MKNDKTNAAKSTNNESVEVLYQKMGDRWFAFSLVGDEVYIGSIKPEEIHEEGAARANSKPKGVDRTGNA